MRHCYTPDGRRESVAEHSWRMTIMAYFIKDEFPEADIDKVIRMCLIHDLGEVFTGDIPTFLKTDKDTEAEDSLLDNWVKTLPEPFAKEMSALYEEMNALETLEARIYKCMDKLEAVIAHNESQIDTWEPLEYNLNLTYGMDVIQFSDYMKELRQTIYDETMDKIKREGPTDHPLKKGNN